MKYWQQTLFFVLLGGGTFATCLAQTLELAVTARVELEPIAEMSGFVKSRSRSNTYWLVNDSGDSARIFAVNSEGNNILPTFSKFSYYAEDPETGKEQWQGFKVLFTENVDWEDMAVDDNFLYIADTGNNGNARTDLGIYIISEIDPTASTQSAAIKYLPVRYPEQRAFPASVWHYDSESLFSDGGSLYLITKHRVLGAIFDWEAGANLYRLDTSYTDEDNLLTLIDSHSGITAATSAEVSPNGETLAVLSLTALWLFEKPEEGDQWLSAPSRKIELNPDNVRQAESLTWEDNQSLWITNEQRDMFLVALDDL